MKRSFPLCVERLEDRFVPAVSLLATTSLLTILQTGPPDPSDVFTAPTVGVADPSQTTIQVAAATIQAGGTATVTVTAADANGNQETTGGSTVVFSLGTGNAQGTFSPVTDNGSGTYTATFTATTAGTNTIAATIDGQTITSTDPTITVTPGTADPTQSTIQVPAATIQAGSTTTVTLTAIDADGNQETAGGSAVVFSLGGGNAQGTFSAVTDNGDGTYTATFTGTTAGTNTITATIDGQTLTAAPTINVTPAPADSSQSTVAVAPAPSQAGAAFTVTLTAIDAYGNQETSGGSAVVFSLGSGGAQGTFSAVTDNGDGTYTATFTATAVGFNTITASIDGQTLTSAAPEFVVVGLTSAPKSALSVTATPLVAPGNQDFLFVIDPYLIDPNTSAPPWTQKSLFYVPPWAISDSSWLDGMAQSLVPPIASPLSQ